jgi:hypothetical protein
MTDTTKSSHVATRRKKRRIAPGLWQLNTDTFEIRVRGINPATGKMDARRRIFQGTRLDAMRERERLYAELTTLAEAQAARERLEAYVRSWLSTGLARGDWRETTARRYAESLDLHVLPSFGHLFIDELTPRLIERALSEWATDHARSTVNSWLRVLRTVLNDAVAHGVSPVTLRHEFARCASAPTTKVTRTTGPMHLAQLSSMPTCEPGATCTRSIWH